MLIQVSDYMMYLNLTMLLFLMKDFISKDYGTQYINHFILAYQQMNQMLILLPYLSLIYLVLYILTDLVIQLFLTNKYFLKEIPQQKQILLQSTVATFLITFLMKAFQILLLTIAIVILNQKTEL